LLATSAGKRSTARLVVPGLSAWRWERRLQPASVDPKVLKALTQDESKRLTVAERIQELRRQAAEMRRQLDELNRQLDETKRIFPPKPKSE